MQETRIRREVKIEVTRDQAAWIETQAQQLGISISNLLRRSVGLPDVGRGHRSDLGDAK